ncbi:hypothetical protein NDU88_005075 [Pleurodeles waltl]|uniref:Uncharacterized protein n=1 Tax=Pleurodeles waltl TaxID=8319 RepID=A0AAV7TTA4_PLEWA|nr:hypothetical protein NDU88_005075 [Pleurodeles waltl]
MQPGSPSRDRRSANVATAKLMHSPADHTILKLLGALYNYGICYMLVSPIHPETQHSTYDFSGFMVHLFVQKPYVGF